jgi:hypothetical protein
MFSQKNSSAGAAGFPVCKHGVNGGTNFAEITRSEFQDVGNNMQKHGAINLSLKF